MKKNGSALLILLLLALIVSACVTNTPQPTSSPTPEPAATTASPSSAPPPSSTPLPSATPAPTQSPSNPPTLTQTLTITPSPTSAFAGFQIQGAEYRYGGFSIYFIIPGITQAYRLEISGQAYSCEYKATLPNRLFCTGPFMPVNKVVDLVFYPLDASATLPIYHTSYVVKPAMTATADPRYKTFEGCPVRGLKSSCETENRIADNGKCIVSTCVDSCGYWYSIDTCIYKTPFYGPKGLTAVARTLTHEANPSTATPAAPPAP